MPNASPIPFSEAYPNPWSFQQTETGTVALMMATPSGFVPILMFSTPEQFMRFKDSVVEATKRFVPVPVQQALKILEQNNWGIAEVEEREENAESDTDYPTEDTSV